MGPEGGKGLWGQGKDEERRREDLKKLDKEDEGLSVVVLH